MESPIHMFSSARDLVVAMLDLIVVQRRLKTHGLANLCSEVLLNSEDAVQPGDQIVASNIASATERAGRLIPGSTCLTRSLALQRSLKRSRIASDLCIGANYDDGSLGAHAWIEISGHCVNGRPDVGRGFKFRLVPDSALTKITTKTSPE